MDDAWIVFVYTEGRVCIFGRAFDVAEFWFGGCNVGGMKRIWHTPGYTEAGPRSLITVVSIFIDSTYEETNLHLRGRCIVRISKSTVYLLGS